MYCKHLQNVFISSVITLLIGCGANGTNDRVSNEGQVSTNPSTTRIVEISRNSGLFSHVTSVGGLVSISMPADFELVPDAKGEDFVVYFVEHQKTAFLGIYLGDHPDFPMRGTKEGHEVTEFKVRDVDIVSEWLGPELLRREMKIGLPAPNDRSPYFAHIWTVDGQPKDVELASKILSSVQVQYQ